jgi:hypothetical protein
MGFSSDMAPGIQSTIETTEFEGRWWAENGENRTLKFGYTVSSTAADAGNTNLTTTLRAGLVMAVKTSDNKLYPYDPTATDGTQNPVGVLPHAVNTLNNMTAAAVDKYVPLWVGGCFDPKKIITTTGSLDANAQRLLAQLGFVFNVWPATNGGTGVQLGSEAFHDWGRTDTKAADYTVTAADNGKMFTATAAVNFTLPTIAVGLAYTFVQTADANMVITGNNNILVDGDAAASTITYSTASHKIGSICHVRAIRVGSAYLWLAQNLGETTQTIA